MEAQTETRYTGYWDFGHAAVYKAVFIGQCAVQDERLRLVGTTATVALLIGRRLTIANVGDSPAFIYSTNGMDGWCR
jgi:hypothetical protein